MEKSNFIGNVKSKEVHKNDCHYVKNIYNVNQRPFRTLDQAKRAGFNTCGHCLPEARESRDTNRSTQIQYFGRFYGIFNGISSEQTSNLTVNPGDSIELFVKLQKAIFENETWVIVPIIDHSVDISCDFIEFETKKTDSTGTVNWSYTIPSNFEPGETVLRAKPHIDSITWNGTGSPSVFFTVPLQIEIIGNTPQPFDQKTKITFKLIRDKRIKADIYRGFFQNEHSHISSLRKFSDGIMPQNDEASLEWDGTIDHGIRKGKSVSKGLYKLVIQGETGESDQDELFLHKREGILGGEDPESDTPNEYITDVHFSRNPFSSRTNVSINFELLKPARVSIHIQHINWNFIDKCVKEITLKEELPAGMHSYVWNGMSNKEKIPATLGKYKVRIKTNEKSYVKKGLWKKAHWNL